MMKKTIELKHDIGDEIIIKVLSQRGFVSMIGIFPNDHIQYQIEYSSSGTVRNRWMDGFEIEKPKNSAIGFVKEKEGDGK